ncbi:collectrin isoform X2 [Sceloporus undulatus]|uniref:collectrin isoform X2 n=1 Tax=Sceloporus undulatus TaxID=8520 RepID=UPI001C4BC6FD|nr:collectrin isoform X2 [Sceloporus undulatus]
MLGGLLLASAWVTVAYAELCRPDGENAFKVRLSIKTALGDNAYRWDATEEYLFKAMVAFAMRRSSRQKATKISNVQLCSVTERVSFWFVVTDSSTNITVPKGDVEAAIRSNKNRINSAFLLDDSTLQFLHISTTLAPPIEPSVPTWLIVFGVVLCLVVVGIVLLASSGICQNRRCNKEHEETEGLQEKCETTLTMENGIPCDTLDLKAGHINGVYTAADDERFAPL